jgi:hypothetical protein
MDEREQNEEHVEDLEPSDEQAEDVKGGFTWSEYQTGTSVKARSQAGDINGVDSSTGNHNQTLIEI